MFIDAVSLRLVISSRASNQCDRAEQTQLLIEYWGLADGITIGMSKKPPKRFERRTNYKSPRKTFLIVCEGIETEPNYFGKLLSNYGIDCNDFDNLPLEERTRIHNQNPSTTVYKLVEKLNEAIFGSQNE